MSHSPVTHVLQARSVTQTVKGPERPLTILHQVTLDVARGEVLAIIGPSGAGKSTLLALLAGLDTPTEGEIHLLGQRIDRLDEDARARLRAGRVGFVFQSFQLVEGLTAQENVAMPLELAGRRDAREQAAEALREVGLAERMRHYPRQLSGGEQQRVALARAFAMEPAILFADEPTGSLDTQTGKTVIDLMFRLRAARQGTLVLVTHDPALADRCDRRVRIEGGLLHEEDPIA
ncbi:MAG: ABC transporter ATP-binding protein [Halothiobacillaceae bacterium]